MSSSRKHLVLSMLKAVEPMFSCVSLDGARERTGGMSVAFLIKVTESRQVTFVNMQRPAGDLRRLKLQIIPAMLTPPARFCQRLKKGMGQSLLSSNGLEKGRLPLVPDSIQQRKQGNVPEYCPCH